MPRKTEVQWTPAPLPDDSLNRLLQLLYGEQPEQAQPQPRRHKAVA